MSIVVSVPGRVGVPGCDLVARYRRFGLHGPVYEVVGDEPRNTERGPTVRVRVVESGEELDYRLESLLGDPVER